LCLNFFIILRLVIAQVETEFYNEDRFVFELSFISGQQFRDSLLSHRVDEHLALGSKPLRLFFLGYILVTNKPYFFGFHCKFLMLILVLFRLGGGWLL